LIKPKTLKLSITDVNEALDDMGINVKEAMNVKNRDALTNLSSRVKKRIIGQDHAVDTVVKSLVRSKLGLRSKKRPMGNFLFLGPTGVGKTELAKVLSEEAFGSRGGSLIRLDMSDFAEKHNVSRLVGAPPGYVGYGEGGELTQKIELHPDSVVLFDEIEKAHPDVLNILLQIMEEGELSDAKGNIFDFSRAVIILTSNLGTNLIQDIGIGFDESKIEDSKVEERLKANLKKVIKPELLNRFDEVIVFRKLTLDDQLKILNLLISDIDVTLKRQDVYVKMPLEARKLLLKKGFSDEYGARALRRVLERELLDKIAEILLQTKTRPLNIQAVATGETLELNTKLS
jgi:ATP-dependent Clp protease ATP-binding subunit ClpA